MDIFGNNIVHLRYYPNLIIAASESIGTIFTHSANRFTSSFFLALGSIFRALQTSTPKLISSRHQYFCRSFIALFIEKIMKRHRRISMSALLNDEKLNETYNISNITNLRYTFLSNSYLITFEQISFYRGRPKFM